MAAPAKAQTFPSHLELHAQASGMTMHSLKSQIGELAAGKTAAEALVAVYIDALDQRDAEIAQLTGLVEAKAAKAAGAKP